MKVLINFPTEDEIVITNVQIRDRNNDGTFSATGDGWVSHNTPLIGLTDDEGNPLDPVGVYVRGKRDTLLQDSDYTQTLDYPATETERTAWAVYRQALRDIPTQVGFPNDIVWPTKPIRDKGGTILQALDPII